MDVTIYTPDPAIQGFVLNISTIHVRLPAGAGEVITPYPPTPFQSLIFYGDFTVSMNRAGELGFTNQPQVVLVGPQFSRVNVKVRQQLSAIRVDFLPGGLFRLLGIPMNELFDGGFNALDFFGPEFRNIDEQLKQTSDLAEGKCVVENFLIRKARSLKELLPVDQALHYLLRKNGRVTMEEAASRACLSLRQFERKCQERVGMNPKLYSRILRFSAAYRMHEASPELSWTRIAQEAGYYDQMHMIRDFRVFAGVNPSEIQQQLRATPIRMQKDLFT